MREREKPINECIWDKKIYHHTHHYYRLLVKNSNLFIEIDLIQLIFWWLHLELIKTMDMLCNFMLSFLIFGKLS